MSKGKGGVTKWRNGNTQRDLSYYTVHKMNSRSIKNGGSARFGLSGSSNRIYDTVTGREI